MYERCPNCKLKYERDPGYFLGSAYLNYGATAMIITVLYVLLRFIAEIESRDLLWPLGLFCVVFPLFFFRYARACWLGMDCHFDPEGFDPQHD